MIIAPICGDFWEGLLWFIDVYWVYHITTNYNYRIVGYYRYISMGDVKSGEIPGNSTTTWDDWRPENGDFEDPQISWFGPDAGSPD